VRKSRKTIRPSYSDTTRPTNLAIDGAPRRKGTYLYIEQPGVVWAVARFRDDDSVQMFKEFILAIAEGGLEIRWSNDVGEGEEQET
jgi:hypothetical protein